ncbi:MAG: hypothetical protein JXA30_02145 [Deltaproteobacteria bacterium]|nr:hypothetical protein [Deltaproteobacteria bacterium]
MKEKRPPEFERDMQTSEFTLILRRFWTAIPTVVVAAFVDQEGECIDCVSSVEPYEARVHAAQIMSIVGTTFSLREKHRFGEPHTIEVATSEKELWARRINDEYTMVAVAYQGEKRSRMKRALLRAVREFRDEVNITRPPWEPPADIIQVETRSATGWQYAPVAFTEEGTRVAISDVFGRWIKSSDIAGQDKVCFRIRTEFGEEMTLMHDPRSDEWISLS